jgi:uncharacterized protein
LHVCAKGIFVSEPDPRPAPATPPRPARWSDRLKLSDADRDKLINHRWLRPIAHRLQDPKLWHTQHEAVARGAAIGMFWAFANPFTIGFWLYLAYELGAWLTGAPPLTRKPEGGSTIAWLTSFGWPAVIGMAIFAVGGAISAYLLVKLGWRVRIWIKRRRR